MNADQTAPFRKHVRLRGFDYRANRAYFVTICTAGRACVFGEVIGSEMRLSRRGMVVQECWQDIPNHHSHVELDALVIMPNHVHGILLFVGNEGGREATQALVAATPASPPARGPARFSLGAVMGSFKAAVSRKINRLRPGAATALWQANYFDHVIRNDRSLYSIRDYIDDNPRCWADDRENPSGSGRDDVEAFVRSLAFLDPSREGSDAGVAATGESSA